MEQLERIACYEALLDRIKDAVSALDAALEGYLAVQSAARALEEYYQSPLWRQDLEADEAGLLPPELKRGVLSEDGAWDALEENRRALIRMLEIAAAALRGGE